MFFPKSDQRFAGDDVHKGIVSQFEIKDKIGFTHPADLTGFHTMIDQVQRETNSSDPIVLR